MIHESHVNARSVLHLRIGSRFDFGFEEVELQVITSSQSPILQTFLVLGEQSNLSSVDVLRLSLRSSVVQVRLCALQTLLQRGGAVEIAAILERIDTCDESELQILVAFSKIFLPAVQLGLADRDPVVRQRSLIAISKLEIESQFHQLIRVAQSSDDTQQMVAAEVLLGLAIRYGNAARLRLEPECETRRQQLLSDLWRSVLSFSEHRIVEIVDAWLCAIHWDDPQFQELFQTGSSRCGTYLRSQDHNAAIETFASPSSQ